MEKRLKFCNRCQTEKPRTEFYKRNEFKNGLQPKCKQCAKEVQAEKIAQGKAWHQLNPVSVLRSNRRAYAARRYEPAELERRRAYYLANREAILAKRKADQPKTNKRVRERAATDPIIGLCKVLKARLSHSARTMGQMVKCGKVLRADRDRLKKRLEMNFKPGMTWTNYGEWHVDHVKPLAAFVVQGKDINLANMLCNLRPEWDSDNKKKSANFKGVNYRIPFAGKQVQNTANS